MPYNIPVRASLINIGRYDEGECGRDVAYNAENIVICGEGHINANGFSLSYNEGPHSAISNVNSEYYHSPIPSPIKTQLLRGRAILAHNTNNLYIKDLLVAYSPSWSIHCIFCRNVTYDGLEVITQGNGETGMGCGTIKKCGHILNGDGIDPESCINVNIFNCSFTTGDDAVALKSGRNKEGEILGRPNRNIRITDCISTGSLGGFGAGSENSGGVQNLLMQNIHINGSAMNGIWFKTLKWRGGITDNVVIRDVTVNDACAAAMFSFAHSSGVTNTVNPAENLPELRNVEIKNIQCHNTAGGVLFCDMQDGHVENISIDGSEINMEGLNDYEYKI